MKQIAISLLCLAASPAFAGDLSKTGTKEPMVTKPAPAKHIDGWYASVGIDQTLGSYDQSSFTKIGGDEKGSQSNISSEPQAVGNLSLGYEKKYLHIPGSTVFWRVQGTVTAQEKQFSDSVSYVVGGATTVDENVDINYKKDGKISMHVGLEPKKLKGFGVYGIVGISKASQKVAISNDQGLNISETNEVFIPEVGIGVQKEIQKGNSMYLEYTMSEMDQQISQRHTTATGYTEHKGDVGFDNLTFGLRFSF